MKLFLVGLPGSGKSTAGKELAAALNVAFVDLDDLIEKNEGKDIPAIFKEHGEDYFRKTESSQLAAWIKANDNFVMATGGGTPCFHDNMKAINKAGKSIFLDVPTHEIVKRIKRTDRAERPLLGRIHPDELDDQMKKLRTKRLSFYAQAHLTIYGEKTTGKMILDQITDRP